MQPQKESQLQKKYPLSCADTNAPITHSLMGFGFSVDDGWYDVINKALGKLEPLIEKWIRENQPEEEEERYCVCGEKAKDHEDLTGACTVIYDVPYSLKGTHSCVVPDFRREYKNYSSTYPNYKLYALRKSIGWWWNTKKRYIKFKLYCRVNRILFYLFEKGILVKQVASNCRNFKLQHPRLFQAKEKFGLLRIYLTGGTDEMYDICDLAEEESSKICEKCGKPGTQINLGWIRTLCTTCAN